MSPQTLLDSFCLTGKITEEHAREIKDLLANELHEAYKKGLEKGLEVATGFIGKTQGWEESEDKYRRHFGLPTKYATQKP